MFTFCMVFSNVLPELAVAHISEFVLFPLVRYNVLKLNVEIWASVGKSCYHACCFGFPHIILNRSATLKKGRFVKVRWMDCLDYDFIH